MTDGEGPEIAPISWCDAEPARFQRDKAEVEALFPDLIFVPPGGSHADVLLPHGGWYGVLPIWPFERPQPDGVEGLVDGTGLEFVLEYPAAYPMIPPTIQPLSPEPEIGERTQATWHVLPAGGLCLLQTTGAWIPEASITDLLLKAAGWRIEYALMKARTIEKMSEAGIVSDDSSDHLLQASPAGESAAGDGGA
jgi:hypothetical protein